MLTTNPTRASRTRIVLAAAAALGAATGGCSSWQARQETTATAREHAAMTALAGYRDAEQFYVKYRQDGRIVYAGGNWRNRVELVERPAPAPLDYAVPSLVPMQYHQESPWDALPPDAIEIPVLDVGTWRELRARLLREVVPRDGSGIVLGFEHTDYFLFYDRAGEFQATRLIDKPAPLRVAGRLRFDDFMRRARPLLDEYLAERGIDDTEFVFNTGDTGPYSLPFLYVNTERRVLAFVRNVPLRAGATLPVPGLKSSQVFGHVLASHYHDLYLRPVSSLHRLFFAITDTAAQSVDLDWAAGLDDGPVPAVANAPPMDLEQWETQLDRITTRPVSAGTLRFLVDGEAFFTRFVEAVTGAAASVRLRTYIFDNDDYAVSIAELLKRRSNEGVDVKVLLDGLGTITATMSDSPSLPDHHRAPASVRRFLESGSRVDVRQSPNPWLTGDHVKSTVIDDRIAFVGGMNIGREYRYDWHDLMMEVRGPVVDTIRREFDAAWAHAGLAGDLGYLIARLTPGLDRAGEEGHPLRVLLTGAGNYEIYSAQHRAIRSARSYIYVQNAYFTDDRLLRELIRARRRAVDVRVIIPMETDHGPITRSNVLAANLMLAHGIRVFLYPGFSHVKAAIYDGWVCVGSANFDRLSLRLNRELNLATSDPGTAQQLLDVLFEPDFRASFELTEPIPERWVDHLVEIVGDFFY